MIKELDMNKYLVFKWDDIREQPLEVKERLAFVQGAIETYRHGKGKKDNKHLVLNLDDEIDGYHLQKTIEEERDIVNKCQLKLHVKDIAVPLVNAILKAKEKKQ